MRPLSTSLFVACLAAATLAAPSMAQSVEIDARPAPRPSADTGPTGYTGRPTITDRNAVTDKGGRVDDPADDQPDCNGNGIFDAEELDLDPGLDTNFNGVIDRCEFNGDLDGSGQVDGGDLIVVVRHWGTCPDLIEHCTGDLNGDAMVDVEDLILVLLLWG